MLLTKEVKIIMNKGSLGFYNKIMNSKFSIDEEVLVPIELVPKSKKVKVMVMCDVCQTEKEVNYNSYNLCLNYGFYSCNKCKNIKKKKTNLQKYGVENFNNTEKRKNTHNLKYGTYYTNRDKAKMTCLENYGVENVSMIDEVKKIKSETTFSNWGVFNPFQSEQIKEIMKTTNLRKYGVSHPSKSENIKLKKIETCNHNFGVDYPMQNPDVFFKGHLSGSKAQKYKGVYYRGTYELDFLKFCELNKLDVKNGPTIYFSHENKRKTYFSDFYLPKFNLICEIKSDYYYQKYLSLNISKKKASENLGYNFIFVKDKKYNELISTINI